MHGRVSCLGATVVSAALLFACGGGSGQSSNAAYPMNTTQQPGYAQPGQTQPGYTQPGQTQPGYTQPGQTQPGYTQPGQTQPGYTQPGTTQPAVTNPPAVTPPAPAPAAVQEMDASMAAPVQPLLKQLASSQVPPGAKPLGNLIVANFPSPGGKLTKQIQLTLNKCYSVVAAGGPGVAEVNLSLVPNLPLATAMAVDNSSGPQATLGANPNCYKQLLFSAPMNLVIDVPQGQGLVGVQVYEK